MTRPSRRNASTPRRDTPLAPFVILRSRCPSPLSRPPPRSHRCTDETTDHQMSPPADATCSRLTLPGPIGNCPSPSTTSHVIRPLRDTANTPLPDRRFLPATSAPERLLPF